MSDEERTECRVEHGDEWWWSRVGSRTSFNENEGVLGLKVE